MKRVCIFMMSILTALCLIGVEAKATTGTEAVAMVSGNDAEPTILTGAMQIEPEEILPTVAVPDEETLFAGYAEQVLYGDMYDEGRIPLYTQTGTESGTRTLEYEDDTLEAIVYDYLREQAALVADGKLASTSIEIPVSLYLDSNTYFTAKDLGVDSLLVLAEPWSNTYRISADAWSAMLEKLEFDAYSVLNSLLVDTPYEFYWFDKTSTGGMGLDYSKLSLSYKSTGKGSVAFASNSKLTVKLRVASAYSKSGETGTTDADVKKTGAASTAAKNAAAVVNGAAGYSDYEKLVAYKDYICDAVQYNREALAPGVEYGDPWQLIYVFDGNPDTDVVCEGYAKAFKYLCDRSKFSSVLTKCHIVQGVLSDSMNQEPHMWNVMAMDDGKNYLVDITNCDSGSIGSQDMNTPGDKLFLVGSTGTMTSTVMNYEGDMVSVPGYSLTIDGFRIFYLYDAVMIQLHTLEELAIAKTTYETGHTIVTGVTLNRSKLSIDPGDTVILKATVAPVTAVNRSIKWNSSNRSVATVDSSGKVTAIGYGKANITVTSIDGGHQAKCLVEIKPPVKEISTLSIARIANKTFTGSPIKPSVTIKDGKTVLKKGTDYKVSYSNNKKLGTATVKITGIGNYKGTVTKKFKIIAPKKGKTFQVNNIKYKVINATSRQLAVVGASSKNATSVVIPATVNIGKTYKVTEVANNAFKGYTKLKRVTIGKNVKSVGTRAFRNCTALNKVTIGTQLKTIGMQAFYGDKNLTSIVCNSKRLTKVGAKAFKGIPKEAKVKVPAAKRTAYTELFREAGLDETVVIQ